MTYEYLNTKFDAFVGLDEAIGSLALAQHLNCISEAEIGVECALPALADLPDTPAVIFARSIATELAANSATRMSRAHWLRCDRLRIALDNIRSAEIVAMPDTAPAQTRKPKAPRGPRLKTIRDQARKLGASAFTKDGVTYFLDEPGRQTTGNDTDAEWAAFEARHGEA